MKSNDESAGGTCAAAVQNGQLCVVPGMNSTSHSFHENATVKTSSRTSIASVSGDCGMHSKSEDLKVSEGRDDCLPCVGGSNVGTGESFGKASNGKYVSLEENPRDMKDNKPSATKKELLEGSTEACDAIASDIVCGDPPATVLNSIKKNDDMEDETRSIHEISDSDIVEQDVNVCDICGNAGREDLLVICSRCSDGAEHTYCMRVMMSKVPEGEWLCEECQDLERVGNVREENIGRIDENEKNNSGYTSSEHINNSDAERERTKGSMRVPSKRHRDDVENDDDDDDDDDTEVYSSKAKKHALESKLGSSRPSNSGKTEALTREIPLKNLDKSKLQTPDTAPSNDTTLEIPLKNLDKSKLQTPDTAPSNDTTESESSASDLRVHCFRGNFSKSNSFPKAKFVDQVVIQRQKSAKESSSFPHKEGVVRAIGKSMSFKSTNPGRSESKVKLVPPPLSHIQGIKNTKQRGPFQRQQSFRTERPSINSATGASLSSTSRIDKRPAVSQGESSLPAYQHETKPVHAEGKSAALSRSTSLAARKTGDLPTSSGGFKRPSMRGNINSGVSSVNGVNNNEHKYNKTSLKEDPPCSLVAERTPLDANEGMPDGLTRHKDLTNSGERMQDCSGSRNGPPPAKPLRDEGGNVKAAIEAAVLRNSGSYWKHRVNRQSNDSSMPSLGCDAASRQDPVTKKKNSSAELPEKPTMSWNMTADSLKQQSSNFAKQSSLVSAEVVSPGGRDCVHINSSSRNMLTNVPAAMPFFLKTVAVPEHEYIWEGSFEICRSGKTSCSWDGIQAHLSTCASPKIIMAVNKFENRIALHEVPRLSTWPVHFQEHGVRENNIALFFFAKDLESYDKIYKVLLDNMMKKDLALKGNVNGIELLIFPSSQLPNNSQRWNMLFFLWGVFRGKKENFLQQMPELSNKICTPLSIPPPIMSLPENRCSVRPIEEGPNGNKNTAAVHRVNVSEELRQRLLLLRAGNRETKTLDKVDHQLNSSSSSALQSINANQCPETGGNSQMNAPERTFFPTNILLEQRQDLNDRAPDLELALGGAESKSPPLDLVGGCSRENELNSGRRILEEAKEEDDVATAALSLSLSFPFPSDSKSEQKVLVPERERLKPTSSMLLFGNLRDDINQ